MAIQVSVSNLNPTPGEIVTFTGSATPIEDIGITVYDELNNQIAIYTIYLKTHGINQIRVIPGLLEAKVQTWKFVGKDTGTQDSAIITIQEDIPPEIQITLSANKTTIEPNDLVTFSVSTNPAASYTVTLEAYVGGVREGLWRVPITDGYGIRQLKPGEIAAVVEWIVKDDQGNVSNTVTTTVIATGPPIGVVKALRLQDVPRSIGYSWDEGIGWAPRTPVVTPEAGALYIAAYILNNGLAGNITATIKDDQGAILSSKTDNVAAGGSMGLEFTGEMPNRNYVVTVIASPGESFSFTIIPYDGTPPDPPDPGIVTWWNNLPWLGKVGIGTGVLVAAVGGVAYVVTKKKGYGSLPTGRMERY